jgi:hypothetical protein
MSAFCRYLPVSVRDEKWGLYATTAGESQIAPGALYPPIGYPGFAWDWPHGQILDDFRLVYVSSSSLLPPFSTSARWMRMSRQPATHKPLFPLVQLNNP